MTLYAFQLGRKHELSLAELVSLIGKDKLIFSTKEIAVFKTKINDPQDFQNRLGGTIKTIEILTELPNPDEESIRNLLKSILLKNLAGYQKKVSFCINLFNFKNYKEINIKQILNFSKIFLKSLQLSSRFLNHGQSNPPPSAIFKSRTLEKGIDLNFIKFQNKYLIGKTLAIQNIDNYTKRDFHKPKRDARVGMLPPKLAQIMINLSGKQSHTIYDPFCGTGTVLMEAMLMGKSVVGSDIEEKMTDYSKQNTDWLQREFRVPRHISSRIFTRDACFLTKELLPEKIDAVVTEGYLGEPQSRFPDTFTREKIFRELENLHLNWLKSLHPLIPTYCKVVMCLTAFKDKDRIYKIPDFDLLAETAGYKITNRLVYDRPDQIVAREILILEKA